MGIASVAAVTAEVARECIDPKEKLSGSAERGVVDKDSLDEEDPLFLRNGRAGVMSGISFEKSAMTLTRHA